MIDRRTMLFGAGPAAALAQQVTTPGETAGQKLRALTEKESIPGLSAAVIVRGRVALSVALGKADVENDVPVSRATRFRIGSVSKLFTASTALRLADRRVLDLDAPVRRYLPSLPEAFDGVTTLALLLHVGGVRHYGRNDYINRTPYSTVTEALKAFQDSPLLFAPGARYSYSSYGYNLAGAVIEAAARMEFGACVRKQILELLRLENTTLDEAEEVIPFRSRTYSLANGRLQNSPYIDLSDRRPSGGFLSSSLDLSLFGAAHLANTLLPVATRHMMFTPHTTPDGKETGAGIGWRIAMIQGEKVYHHGGDALGGRAFLLLRPQHETAVAITCNLSFAKIAEPEAMAISEPFIG